MNPDYNCACLIAALLSLLDDTQKHRITRLLDGGALDRSLDAMIRLNMFPGWFARSFAMDPLYGRLDGLRYCMTYAAREGLLRMDGTNFNYHPELSERVIDHLLESIPFEKAKAKDLARRLNAFLADSP